MHSKPGFIKRHIASVRHISCTYRDTLHRDMILAHVKNEATIAFWQNEFLKFSPTLRAEAITPILSKTGLFVTSVPLRNVVGQTTSDFKMQQVLDGSKILLCNLSKGMIGEDACTLLAVCW